MEKYLKEKSLEELYGHLLHLRSISEKFVLKIDDEWKVTDAIIKVYQAISGEERPNKCCDCDDRR